MSRENCGVPIGIWTRLRRNPTRCLSTTTRSRSVVTSCGSRKRTASWTTPQQRLFDRLQMIRAGDYGGTASTTVDPDEIAAIVRALGFSDVEVGLDEDERALLTKLTSLRPAAVSPQTTREWPGHALGNVARRLGRFVRAAGSRTLRLGDDHLDEAVTRHSQACVEGAARLERQTDHRPADRSRGVLLGTTKYWPCTSNPVRLGSYVSRA
jgi:hypothetical protein